jgi:hypothetical protein
LTEKRARPDDIVTGKGNGSLKNDLHLRGVGFKAKFIDSLVERVGVKLSKRRMQRQQELGGLS